jgi:thioredoxin 1
MAENNVAKSGLWWKILIVVALVVVVSAVIISKKGAQVNPLVSTPVVSDSYVKHTDILAESLKSGKPVIADFGRGKCIPCKAMKPILEELSVTYKDKVDVFILDIDEYADLTNEHGVQMIPTQIFFDKSGNEVWRHEGFLEKEKITEKLAELGVK